MYKIRPGHVVEASLIGAVLTLGATFIGGFIPGSPLQHFFEMKDTTVIIAMAIYGFVASVLPVWVLLCPRDYLSSFLKIGTILVLVGGVIIANPKMKAPAINHTFLGRRADGAGAYLSVPLHRGDVWGDQRLPRPGEQRHDAEDDQEREGTRA